MARVDPELWMLVHEHEPLWRAEVAATTDDVPLMRFLAADNVVVRASLLRNPNLPVDVRSKILPGLLEVGYRDA